MGRDRLSEREHAEHALLRKKRMLMVLEREIAALEELVATLRATEELVIYEPHDPTPAL